MYHIIYMSSSSRLLKIGELLSVLVRSRENNLRQEITGILFYRDGNFLGCLEGEEEIVKSLFGKIQRDPLHSHVTVQFSESIEKRDFTDWTMAFRERDHPMPCGFHELLNQDNPDIANLPLKVRVFMRIFINSGPSDFSPSQKSASAGNRTPSWKTLFSEEGCYESPLGLRS